MIWNWWKYQVISQETIFFRYSWFFWCCVCRWIENLMEPCKQKLYFQKKFQVPTNLWDPMRSNSKSIRNWSYWSFLTMKCEISSYKILRQMKFYHWRQKSWVPYEVKTKNLQKIWKWSNIKIGKTSLTEGFQPSYSGFVSTLKNWIIW